MGSSYAAMYAKMNLKTYLSGTTEEKANMTKMKNRFNPLFPVLSKKLLDPTKSLSSSNMESIQKGIRQHNLIRILERKYTSKENYIINKLIEPISGNWSDLQAGEKGS
jgi:hypothetical protein